MITMNNKPLTLAFIIVGIIFLLFCGGAMTTTMLNDGTNKVSWMWIPTLVAFILTVLLGWALFWEKK